VIKFYEHLHIVTSVAPIDSQCGHMDMDVGIRLDIFEINFND
jgi:hypothetical protein